MFGYNYHRFNFNHRFRTITAMFILPALIPLLVQAQQSAGGSEADRRFAEMTALIQRLQARVDDLEEKLQSPDKNVTPATVSNPIAEKPQAPTTAAPVAAQGGPDLLRGTTVNILLDGYYALNFNNPIGRVNLLRAYDVSSNSFSLSQAGVVLEN